jgi:hypothetical protein
MRKIMTSLCCFQRVLYLSFLIASVFGSISIGAESQALRVKIINGSNQGQGRADSIKVILLKESMVTIHEEKSLTGSFSLPKLDLPDGIPVLLQVSYKGANYNKMVPPVPKMRTMIQEIIVYETSSDKNLIQTRSLMQVVREKKSLQIFKIYLLQNETKPPRSIYSDGLEFYIPESAVDIQGSWTQGNSKMAIPLSFKDQGNGQRLVDRAVLPGSTEVQISYRIPIESEDTIQFKDKMFFEAKDRTRPIFIKPLDMKASFSSDANPQILKNDIPEGLQAFMVNYSTEKYETDIILEGGTPVVPMLPPGSRKIVNGNLISEWDSSLAGVIGFLGLFFLLGLGFEIGKGKRKLKYDESVNSK